VQGTLNPNLADFGERSESRQYSGREVEEGWRCPFHRSNGIPEEKP
jgi:FPC/CPF motif-containing protein YcgG